MKLRQIAILAMVVGSTMLASCSSVQTERPVKNGAIPASKNQSLAESRPDLRSLAPASGGESSGTVDFGPYMAAVQRKIKKNWFPPKGTESEHICVMFCVSPNGTVSKLRLTKPSKNIQANQAALAAVSLAGSFEPLPEGASDTVDIEFTFDYNVYKGDNAEKRSFVLPDIGSPIASAMVIYDSRKISLDTRKIAEIINKFGKDAAAKAEDVRMPEGEVFPLVRVSAPVELVIVVNDSPDSVQEIREMADDAEKKQQLPKELIAKLRSCNARLDVSSANNPPMRETDDAIVLEGKTDLDPANPAVKKFLHALQGSTQGLTFDCVNDEWLKR